LESLLDAAAMVPGTVSQLMEMGQGIGSSRAKSGAESGRTFEKVTE